MADKSWECNVIFLVQLLGALNINRQQKHECFSLCAWGTFHKKHSPFWKHIFHYTSNNWKQPKNTGQNKTQVLGHRFMIEAECNTNSINFRERTGMNIINCWSIEAGKQTGWKSPFSVDIHVIIGALWLDIKCALGFNLPKKSR